MIHIEALWGRFVIFGFYAILVKLTWLDRFIGKAVLVIVYRVLNTDALDVRHISVNQNKFFVDKQVYCPQNYFIFVLNQK